MDFFDLVKHFLPNKVVYTVSPTITTASQVILNANSQRRGLIIYNNSANSGYVMFGPTASSVNLMSVIIPTFAQIIFPFPVYTGLISAIRNAGTGTFLITELTIG